MIILEFIKLLAEVCRYNAVGEIYIRSNGKNIPYGHTIDHFIGRGKKRKRVIVIVPQGEDYYGE